MIEKWVKQTLSTILLVDEALIWPETRLIEDLHMSMLDTAEFILDIEDKFDLTIAVEFNTIEDVMEFIHARTGYPIS